MIFALEISLRSSKLGITNKLPPVQPLLEIPWNPYGMQSSTEKLVETRRFAVDKPMALTPREKRWQTSMSDSGIG